MFRRQVRSAWCSLVVLLLAPLLMASQPSSAPAAEKLGNALDFIPADAAFYASAMRGKEQLDVLLASKAWAKIQNLPAVQMGWQAVQAQLNQPGSPLALLQLPENQELLELLGDLVSHESFVYGDDSWLGAMQLLAEFNTVRYRSVAAQVSGEMNRKNGGERNPEEENRSQARLMLESLNRNLNVIRIPNLLLGFKISDTAPAKRQLKRLEVLANLLLGQNPVLKDRLKRGTIGQDEFLTFTLDGTLVPWDQIPFDKFENQPGEFDKLKAKLQQMTLVISLGVRDKYFLVSIGGSNAAVARLGKGNLLAGLPEFKALKKFAAERLTGVGFVSKAIQVQSGLSKKDVDGMAALVSEYLVPKAPVSDEVKARIGQDLKRLAADIGANIPEPGAVLSFGFLTGQGYEEYVYNWTQNLALDDSKPLTLVQNLGGAPLAAVLARSKNSAGGYALLVKWIKVFHGYFEEIGVSQLPPQKRDEYLAVRDAFLPLVRRADAVTRTMLIPALADGQQALVLDAKIKSRQWHKKMPMTQEPLPMLEISLVLGVSDASLLKKACAEYKAIADDGLVKVRELNPGKIPEDFKIPDPTYRAIKTGVVYTYPLPKEAGLDGQLAPNAGLGAKVAVLSLAPKHTARLLTPTPLAAEGILANAQKRPLAVLTTFNWPTLIDAVEPWVEFGVRAATSSGALEGAGGDSVLLDEAGRAKLAEVVNDSDQTKMILEHVRVVAEVLKAVRSMGSVTYSEGSAMVTHVECRMKDID